MSRAARSAPPARGPAGSPWRERRLSGRRLLCGGLVKGFTGFGGALVMAPIFTFVLDPAQTLGTVVTINVATAWQLLGRSWASMQAGVILPMAGACALLTPVGIALVLLLDPASERRIVGGAILASGVALLCGWRRAKPPRLTQTMLVGALSGVMNGIAGVGGPPAALWLLAGRDGAARDRAGLIVYVALTQTAVAAMAFAAGVLDGGAVLRALWLAPIHIGGTLAGTRLFSTAPDMVVRIAMIVSIIVLGAVTVLL